MRVVFVGQSTSFSWPSLLAIAADHEIVAIVESIPGRMRARQPWPKRVGKRVLRDVLRRPWLDQYAAQHRIPYLRLHREGMEAFAALLTSLKPDVACVASMSHLLPAELLDIPRFGFLNFHPSALPAYRGPNPWVWQILANEDIGIVIHRIDAGEDTGPVVRRGTPVRLTDVADAEDLVGRVSQQGASLYRAVLQELAAGQCVPQAQPEQSPTPRARTVKSHERLVDWQNWSLERVERTLRLMARWHDELPPAGRGRRWQFLGTVAGSAGCAPQELKRADGEWRLAHRDGYIRLRRRWAR